MEVDDVILIESQLRESMDWTEELKKIKSVGTLLTSFRGLNIFTPQICRKWSQT